MAGRQELDKENARPHGQPQIPTQRQVETGPHSRQCQKTPRFPLLPVQDGVLPNRSVPGLDYPTPRRHLLVVSVQYPNTGASPQWRCQQRTLWTTVLKETRKLPGPTRERRRTSIAELLADERCSQAVLQFLATTDVGRTSGPPVAEDDEDAASEASEWEARDQEERAWERREEEERLRRE